MRRVTALISMRSFANVAAGLGAWPSAAAVLPLAQPSWAGSWRGYKKQANEIRSGNVLEIEGRLMVVVKQQHTQGAGRQLGNVQFELRDLRSGSKSPAKFRPYDQVDVARLDERRMQCLYREGNTVHCMEPETYAQEAVDVGLFGEQGVYLAEGMDVTLASHEGTPVQGSVPSAVTLRVAEASPHMKGETAAPSYKPATMENGVKVMVPPFVGRGDEIIVDTATGTFVKRA